MALEYATHDVIIAAITELKIGREVFSSIVDLTKYWMRFEVGAAFVHIGLEIAAG